MSNLSMSDGEEELESQHIVDNEEAISSIVDSLPTSKFTSIHTLTSPELCQLLVSLSVLTKEEAVQLELFDVTFPQLLSYAFSSSNSHKLLTWVRDMESKLLYPDHESTSFVLPPQFFPHPPYPFAKELLTLNMIKHVEYDLLRRVPLTSFLQARSVKDISALGVCLSHFHVLHVLTQPDFFLQRMTPNELYHFLDFEEGVHLAPQELNQIKIQALTFPMLVDQLVINDFSARVRFHTWVKKQQEPRVLEFPSQLFVMGILTCLEEVEAFTEKNVTLMPLLRAFCSSTLEDDFGPLCETTRDRVVLFCQHALREVSSKDLAQLLVDSDVISAYEAQSIVCFAVTFPSLFAFSDEAFDEIGWESFDTKLRIENFLFRRCCIPVLDGNWSSARLAEELVFRKILSPVEAKEAVVTFGISLQDLDMYSLESLEEISKFAAHRLLFFAQVVVREMNFHYQERSQLLSWLVKQDLLTPSQAQMEDQDSFATLLNESLPASPSLLRARISHYFPSFQSVENTEAQALVKFGASFMNIQALAVHVPFLSPSLQGELFALLERELPLLTSFHFSNFLVLKHLVSLEEGLLLWRAGCTFTHMVMSPLLLSTSLFRVPLWLRTRNDPLIEIHCAVENKDYSRANELLSHQPRDDVHMNLLRTVLVLLQEDVRRFRPVFELLLFHYRNDVREVQNSELFFECLKAQMELSVFEDLAVLEFLDVHRIQEESLDTPLLAACKHSVALPVFEFLFQLGANAAVQNAFGFYAIDSAVQFQLEEAIIRLILHHTPQEILSVRLFHYAVDNRNASLVSLLLTYPVPCQGVLLRACSYVDVNVELIRCLVLNRRELVREVSPQFHLSPIRVLLSNYQHSWGVANQVVELLVTHGALVTQEDVELGGAHGTSLRRELERGLVFRNICALSVKNHGGQVQRLPQELFSLLTTFLL